MNSFIILLYSFVKGFVKIASSGQFGKIVGYLLNLVEKEQFLYLYIYIYIGNIFTEIFASFLWGKKMKLYCHLINT
jgi:hypothetical protein